MSILDKFEHYRNWRAIKNGKKPINMRRGAGYYITVGLFGGKTRGRIEEIPMESGRTAIAELIDFETFRDPSDMIKESFWHTSGYKGEKSFKDMSFKEYLKEFEGKS